MASPTKTFSSDLNTRAFSIADFGKVAYFTKPTYAQNIDNDSIEKLEGVKQAVSIEKSSNGSPLLISFDEQPHQFKMLPGEADRMALVPPNCPGYFNNISNDPGSIVEEVIALRMWCLENEDEGKLPLESVRFSPTKPIIRTWQEHLQIHEPTDSQKAAVKALSVIKEHFGGEIYETNSF